jgi:hypothetical protein
MALQGARRLAEAWSASGLSQAIKVFLAQAADDLEGVDAQQLRKASTHWLRHSHITLENKCLVVSPFGLSSIIA